MRKGQSSVEYLPVIIVVALVAIFLVYRLVDVGTSDIALAKADKIVKQLALISNDVGSSGAGSVRCAIIDVPSGVIGFGAAKNEVYMMLDLKGERSDVSTKTNNPATGVLPVTRGQETICVSNSLPNGASTGNNHFYIKGATCDADKNKGCFSYCGTTPDPDCNSGIYGDFGRSFCGDGIVKQGVEDCDIGTKCGPGTTCDSTCECVTSTETIGCGDGAIGPGEECDTAGRECFWTSKSCPKDAPAKKTACKNDCTCSAPQPVYSCGDGVPPEGGYGASNSCGVEEQCEKREDCPQYLAGDKGVSCVNCKCVESPLLCGDSATPYCGGTCLNTGDICKDNGNGACECVPGCGGDGGLCSGACKDIGETCVSRLDENGKPGCECVKGGLQQQYIAGYLGGECLGGDIMGTCGGSCIEGVCLPDPRSQSCTCS